MLLLPSLLPCEGKENNGTLDTGVGEDDGGMGAPIETDVLLEMRSARRKRFERTRMRARTAYLSTCHTCHMLNDLVGDAISEYYERSGPVHTVYVSMFWQ